MYIYMYIFVYIYTDIQICGYAVMVGRPAGR